MGLNNESIVVSARELHNLTKPNTTINVPGRNVGLGDTVKAKYQASVLGPARTLWYTGTVTRVHEDGTIDIRYDDGDEEQHVKREYVKPMKVA